jgi:hypothetical protein
MTKKELIEKINNSHYKSLWEVEECIPDEVKKVAEGLELDEHRWFSTAINVYEVEDGFVGIQGAYQSFSEMQSWKDIDWDCTAFPMKQVQTVTYVISET